MYSGSVYGQRCGQIRVPDDCHVVLFSGDRCARNLLRRQRKTLRAEKKHTNRHMWSNSYREMINMWSDKIDQQRAENYLVLLLQMLYCNLELHDCQGPLRIKINAQNLIRSKQRKSSLRSFPSCRHKTMGTRMMDMVAFTFWSINTPVKTQNLICSKQRKGSRSSNHR